MIGTLEAALRELVVDPQADAATIEPEHLAYVHPDPESIGGSAFVALWVTPAGTSPLAR